MCTYNGALYLREQLESIAAQTRLPDELGACDDGSTDHTLAILERFAAAAPFPVRIHVNPTRLGTSKNFERAIGLARARSSRSPIRMTCGIPRSWSAWSRSSPAPSASA